MERLGAGRIAVIAAVGMVALSGCQTTQGEAGPTATSSPAATSSATPEVTETATATPAETEQPAAAWAVASIDSAGQCDQFTEAMKGELSAPEVVTFRSIFFGQQGDEFVQLGDASDNVCSWTPVKSAEQKWRETSLHIATIPASEDFDAASTFDEFESSAEGQSLGTSTYASESLGAGTVYTLDDVVHGEAVNADICHYVEDRSVVTITREADGQCVAALEQAVAVAKG
ncbi:hypothetical protein [Pseudoclavibacter terrae]|uniref:DUF3558 domain-containing protein n=1 Tax=Pseudoclavibacter terrae TaxID=1530195 RepID=A0A7J5B6D0_9MICO|nr:hypothetical protein [Pseudoclavibacter terrae]KAB1639653.1 hypothetical protein F8O03_04840 [Pseudoclavibacter terrae]